MERLPEALHPSNDELDELRQRLLDAERGAFRERVQELMTKVWETNERGWRWTSC